MLSSSLVVLASTLFLPTSEAGQTPFLPSSSSSRNPVRSIRDPYSPVVFNSLNGLLKSWPQAFEPNGRAIVPGIIPTGTVMYHGGAGGKEIEGMEWFALDPEHAYGFAFPGGPGAPANSVGSLYIYTSTRPLKVLYFDGQSAAKLQHTLELQNILAYGNGTSSPWSVGGLEGPGDPPSPPPPERPRGGGGGGDGERSLKLCEMFEPYGIQGFIRLEGVYEVIWCDFKDGVELIHVTNTTDPFYEPSPFADDFEAPPPPRGPGPGPGPGRGRRGGVPNDQFRATLEWSRAQASSWHYHLPEPRVKLFPQFYITLLDVDYPSVWKGNDPGLKASEKTLLDVTNADSEKFKNRVFEIVEAWNPSKSKLGGVEGDVGVDWSGIAQTVSDRASHKFMEMETILENFAQHRNATKTVIEIQQISYSILLPFTDYHHVLNSTVDDHTRKLWIEKTGETCSGMFTKHIETLEPKLPWWEKKLLDSIKDVSTQICTFASQSLSLSLLSPATEYGSVVSEVSSSLHDLMDYLRWPGWNRCDRMCDWDEICFVPLWPIGGFGRDGGEEVKGECLKRDSRI